MTYLLDTNPCVRYLNGRSEPLRRRIDAARDDKLAVCSIVKAELAFGAAKSHVPTQTRAAQALFLSRLISFPFDDRAAAAFGPLRAELEQRGLPIGSNDLMIASIAIANDLTLVTANLSEFNRISDLRVENWELPEAS